MIGRTLKKRKKSCIIRLDNIKEGGKKNAVSFQVYDCVSYWCSVAGCYCSNLYYNQGQEEEITAEELPFWPEFVAFLKKCL